VMKYERFTDFSLILISLLTKASHGIVPTIIEYSWTLQAMIIFSVSTSRSSYESVSLLIKYLVLITITLKCVSVGMHNSNYFFRQFDRK
jgi:hypothetical protein